jgi:small subunit ribosomal protein S18
MAERRGPDNRGVVRAADPDIVRRSFGRRKVCRFCADKNAEIGYTDTNLLRHFITERGKIVPRRISGNCAKHQRSLSLAIKRSRMLGLMPYTVGTV